MRSTQATIQTKAKQLETLRYTTRYIVAYTHYLVMKAQLAGNLVFNGHKPSVEEQNIALKIREICDVIDRKLSVCSEDTIADLLECYDLTYRIGYQKLPDKSKINCHKHRLVSAWTSNKVHVEDSSVFGMISGDVRYQNGNVDSDFVDAYNSILKKWCTALLQNLSFPDASPYEKYQRLSMLMPLNLNTVLGRSARKIKQKWYEANKVDDLSALNSQILRSYLRFIGSLPPEVMDFRETMVLKSKVLRELSQRKDLEPLDAEAFRMALEFHNKFMQS